LRAFRANIAGGEKLHSAVMALLAHQAISLFLQSPVPRNLHDYAFSI